MKRKTSQFDYNKIGKTIEELVRFSLQHFQTDYSLLQICKSQKGKKPDDVKEAWRYGTKPLDAFIWSKAKKEDTSREFNFVNFSGDSDKNNYSNANKTFFYLYLFTLLKASHPRKDSHNPLPELLIKLAGPGLTESTLAAAASNLDLKIVDCRWIKDVKVVGMHPTVRSSLVLELPSYRMINAIKLLELRSDVSNLIRTTHLWIEKNLCANYYWDIYPLTRSMNVIKRCPCLEKSLADFMARAYTDVSLRFVVEKKILHTMPVKNKEDREWQHWAEGGPLVLNHEIFSKTIEKDSVFSIKCSSNLNQIDIQY